MRERTLIRTNVNVYKDTLDALKDEGTELSSLVRELLDNYIESTDILKTKRDKLQSQLNNINSIIELKDKEDEEMKLTFKRIKPEQVKFIIETINLINKEPKYFNGRLKAWNNISGMKLNEKEFRELLDTYRDEKEVK